MPDTEKKDNTPTLLPDEFDNTSVTFRVPTDIKYDDPIETHVQADLEIANRVVEALHVCWGNVRSIPQVIKLATTTLDVLERRRHLALKQYAAPKQSNVNPFFTPID